MTMIATRAETQITELIPMDNNWTTYDAIAWMLAIVSGVGDTASTIYAISLPTFREGNPAMAWAIGEWGPIAIVVAHALALGVVYLFWRWEDEYSWVFPTAVVLIWMPAFVWNSLLLTGVL